MIFFHGGAFLNGASLQPVYDGTALAQRSNVVVVTVNYRLGPLGFLAHPSLSHEDPAHPVSGNYGLLDQRAAMSFVKRNAARFGGDVNSITLFGESAGGISG
jgi:para-nitrobenzyl esterase